MQIFSKNPNNISYSGKSIAFKGDVKKFMDSVAGPIAVAKRASCKNGKLTQTFNTLVTTTLDKAPELIEQVNGVYIPKNEKFTRKLIEAGRDFLELPLDLLDDIASHFPNSRLNNLGILQKHREHILAENRVKAFQGFFDYGAEVLSDEKINARLIPPSFNDNCTDECIDVCAQFANKYNEQLNKTAELNKATYDTKKERFITRMISGLTAALFLGNDFYNSAILKGKSEEEAKKAQGKKQAQEIKENIIEGFAQYGILSCFSKLASSNIWFSVFSGTGVGIIAKIISRKISGMPLGRMKAPENSMKEFVKAAKNNEQYKTQSEKDNEAKKPILSLKNIALGCVAIIATGFALKKGTHVIKIKDKIIGNNKETEEFITIAEKIRRVKEKSYKASIEPIEAKADELQNMANILKKYNEEELGMSIQKFASQYTSSDTIKIGEKYKIIKLPGGLTVTQRAFKKALFTPFRIAKEIVTYPYKLASNFVNAMSNSKMNKEIERAKIDFQSKMEAVANARNTSEEPILAREARKAHTLLEELQNKRKTIDKLNERGSKKLGDAGIKNLYNRYKLYEQKFGSDPQKLEEEFGKYIQRLRAASLNNQTSSKIDNSQIAVLAQVTGTLAGMTFNMNDDYNAAIRNGEDKQGAEKAARKRGLNKFARMTSQIAISGALNKLFKAQYQGSLLGAGIIVAISTVITDMVSRVLTAMPTKKMTKERLEQYQNDHKTGKMAWYYNMIDKLAS